MRPEDDETVSTSLSTVDESIKTRPYEFVMHPRDEDIIVGGNVLKLGNRLYRDIVLGKMESYKKYPESHEDIALGVMHELTIRRPGRFLKKDRNHGDGQYRVMKDNEITKEILNTFKTQGDNYPLSEANSDEESALVIETNVSDFTIHISEGDDTAAREEQEEERDGAGETERERQEQKEGMVIFEMTEEVVKSEKNSDEENNAVKVSATAATSTNRDTGDTSVVSLYPLSIKGRIDDLEKLVFGSVREDTFLIQRLIWLENNIMETKDSGTFIERLASVEVQLGISTHKN